MVAKYSFESDLRFLLLVEKTKHVHIFPFLVHIFCSYFFKLFKIPLEKEGQVGGPILAQEEMKNIFGSIPEIYDVHTRIKVECPELFASTWL